MAIHILYLSNDENIALNALFLGGRARYVQEVNQFPRNGWYTFTSEIRRKTGISNLLDRAECQKYYNRYAAAMAGIGPSKDETYAMRLFVRKISLSDDQSTQLASGLLSAGIFSSDIRARRSQSRLYLALFRPNGAKPSPQELAILRGMADGAPFNFIASQFKNMTAENVVEIASDVCIRLGFDTPGRNAQRNLLRAYFAYLDASQPPQITMEDPLF